MPDDPDELVLCLVILEAQPERVTKAAGRVLARPRPADEPAPTLTGMSSHAEWRMIPRSQITSRRQEPRA